MKVSGRDLRYVQGLVRELSGNLLGVDRDYLLQPRLSPLAARMGYASVPALLHALQKLSPGPQHIELVECMTTKETMFFRDAGLFDTLRDRVLPALQATGRRLEFWCLGCSTGQEPYSVAMLTDRHFPQVPMGLRASDISRAALAVAEAGCYNDFEIRRGLPPDFCSRYFAPGDGGWHVSPSIRRRVSWSRINLADPLPVGPPVDVVLLRNVLLYFEPQVKRQVLAAVRQVLRPDGFLFLGAPENLLEFSDLFAPQSLGPTFAYRPRPDADGLRPEDLPHRSAPAALDS